MKHIEIIPALLTDDIHTAKDVLSTVAEFTDRVQIDVGDGSFSKTRTLQAKDISRDMLRGLKAEVQLMVYHPEQYVSDWIRLGADRIIVHVESQPHASVFHEIRDAGKEAMVGVTAHTNIDAIEPFLHLVSGVLFLSISPPGMQGQPFLQEVIDKVSVFHEKHPEYDIEIDGGVSEHNIQKCIAAGATRFVMGSGLFSSSRPPKEQFAYITSLLQV